LKNTDQLSSGQTKCGLLEQKRTVLNQIIVIIMDGTSHSVNIICMTSHYLKMHVVERRFAVIKYRAHVLLSLEIAHTTYTRTQVPTNIHNATNTQARPYAQTQTHTHAYTHTHTHRASVNLMQTRFTRRISISFGAPREYLFFSLVQR